MESKMDTVFSDKTQDMLFQMEADSWWFQYRAKVITGLMSRYYEKSTKTVDVGGGNGYTTMIAQRSGFEMSLLEPSEEACRNARKRGIEAHAGLMTRDYPDDGMYEQALLLDVLEHIEDDQDFLDLLHKKIARGGLLLITVPAYKLLWSSEDDYAKHYRRYTKKELREKAEKSGFDVLYAGYFMQFLFIPILFIRVWLERIGVVKRQNERTEEERAELMEKQFQTKKGGIISIILKIVEDIEYKRLMRGQCLKFGASVIMILQRRN
jgi:SAM-dependent methyltransferase